MFAAATKLNDFIVLFLFLQTTLNYLEQWISNLVLFRRESRFLIVIRNVNLVRDIPFARSMKLKQGSSSSLMQHFRVELHLYLILIQRTRIKC